MDNDTVRLAESGVMQIQNLRMPRQINTPAPRVPITFQTHRLDSLLPAVGADGKDLYVVFDYPSG